MVGLYFAYGSNMWTEQMLQRCPRAANPRAAVLADHDWLINARGVATIEAAPGREVHGVVWDVTGEDLAALDVFEGVPERYVRRTATVSGAAGALDVHVYVDPVVEPGPARPGYLERVRAGAAEHALPDEWQRALARWDRAVWERRAAVPVGAGAATLTELLAADGGREELALRSSFGFMAIHGGELEAMTDGIARRAAARAGASYYGVLHRARYHLPSTRFTPTESPRLARFLAHVDVVVSIHGYGRSGRWTDLLVGGTNRALAAHLSAHLAAVLPGYAVVTDLDVIPAELRGLHPRNPVNLPRDGGVQIELPPRVRGHSPRSPLPGADGISPVTHALVDGLVAAARTWH